MAGWSATWVLLWKYSPYPEHVIKLFAGARPETARGGLLLAGHTITVPFDDGRLPRDPFYPTEHDNKLYGWAPPI